MPDRVHDFHLIVNKVQGDERSDRFVVAVAHAPVPRFNRLLGQFTLRATDQGWRPERGRLALARSQENSFQLAPADGEPMTPEQIGHELFALLFPPGSDTRALLAKSCTRLGSDEYLRLRLELHQEVATLPWELIECPLADPDALEITQTPLFIIRFLGDLSTRPAKPGSQPRMLVLQADPEGISSPGVKESFEEELLRLTTTLDRVGLGYTVVRGPDTRRQLLTAVNEIERNPATCLVGLHFIGHGSVRPRGSCLLGEDAAGKVREIYAPDLMKWLHTAGSLRWVILNACSTAYDPPGAPLTGLATSLSLLKNVPTVIAYKRPVGTKDAELLADQFYGRVLAGGEGVEAVIRSVQIQADNPGGLVVLQRSRDGRIEDQISLEGVGEPPAEPEPLRAPRRSRPERPQPAASATAGAGDTTDASATASAQAPAELPAPARPFPSEGDLVRVPAGTLQRGLSPRQVDFLVEQFRRHGIGIDPDSARSALSAERHEEVVVPGFMIGRCLVTNEQFAAFAAETGYLTTAERNRDQYTWRSAGPEKRTHPVVYVSHDDAVAFCKWAGCRLPTLEEWQKAFRGTDGRLYAWGDEYDPRRCNTAESQRGFRTTPVDFLPQGASPYGCLDMVGNVEEWTATRDEFDLLSIVGGSWEMTCEVYGLPVLQRLARADFYSDDLGFRCARS